MVSLSWKDSGTAGYAAFITAMNEASADLADALADRLTEIIKEEAGQGGTIFGQWEPLSEVTQILTGRESPLENIGDYVVVEKSGDYMRYVYINHPWISVIENGALIEVTPRMRRWYAAQGLALSDATSEILIPGRPVMEPAMVQLNQELPKIMAENVGFWKKIQATVLTAVRGAM